MKDKLGFDVTDANTILDSDSVGSFLRAEEGSLYTHRRAIRKGTLSYTISNAAFGSDELDINPSHDLVEGQAVKLSTDGTLPTGLDNSTTYYVIRVTDQTIQLAASKQDAYDGVAVSFSDAGSGTHTITEQDMETVALEVSLVDGLNVEVDIDASEDSIASWTHDGTGTAITSTSENGDQALDVHLSNTEIAVTQGSDSPWAVEATDLDIRDLQFATDEVQIGNASGVADFGSGATTAQTLRVTLATDTDIDVSDAALADTAILSANADLTAAGTAETVVASNLANRKYLFVRNIDNRTMYIGGSGVDKDNGFPISQGAYIELRAGANVDVYYDSEKTGHEIRTLELS